MKYSGCCREIYERFRVSYKGKPDIHTKLMKKYDDIPAWWFYVLLVSSLIVSLLLCTILKDQVQLPWWALLFACAIAFVFTLPISIITATTNQVPVHVYLVFKQLSTFFKQNSDYFHKFE